MFIQDLTGSTVPAEYSSSIVFYEYFNDVFARQTRFSLDFMHSGRTSDTNSIFLFRFFCSFRFKESLRLCFAPYFRIFISLLFSNFYVILFRPLIAIKANFI